MLSPVRVWVVLDEVLHRDDSEVDRHPCVVGVVGHGVVLALVAPELQQLSRLELEGPEIALAGRRLRPEGVVAEACGER